MELSSHEAGDIPIPLNSSFGHGHMIHHDPHTHIISSPSPQNQIPPPPPPAATTTTNGGAEHDHDHHHNNNNNNIIIPSSNYKKLVKYRECLKNHAAAMGGNATDGCGEFMPSGDEGTIEALTCSACNCHRNFHRKEIEGDESDCFNSNFRRKVIVGHHHLHQKNNILGYPTGSGALRTVPPHHHHPMIMSYNMGSLPSDQSDEQEEGGPMMMVSRAPPPLHQMVKKRFRTKFTQEQKEKMLNFAEKVGWKIQKQEEAVVQQFCQEIGVKRRVLKVWMHNNKHNLAKNNPSTAST